MSTDVQLWRHDDKGDLEEEIVELRRLPEVEPRRLAKLAEAIRAELDAADTSFADDVQHAIRPACS
jgi:hypothetical protein